jgi:hypothetical protein
MHSKRKCNHPHTEENTYRRRNGKADGCLTCRRKSSSDFYVSADKDRVRRLQRERYARAQEMNRTVFA